MRVQRVRAVTGEVSVEEAMQASADKASAATAIGCFMNECRPGV